MTRKTHRCPGYGHGRFADAGWAFHLDWCKYAQKAASRTAKVAEPVKPIVAVKPVTAIDPDLVATIVALVLTKLAS